MYKVAVLRGGPSAEHEVSMHSGAAVINALKNTEFTPVDVVISKNSEWLRDGKVWDPLNLIKGVDVVFIALHGSYGEDGVLQRFLETHQVPFTGSGSFASATAMNKALAKDQLSNLGIKMAPHMYANRDNISNYKQYAEAVAEVFSGPYILKPVNSGSSVGTVIAKNPIEMESALEELFTVFDRVMVEQFIKGKEATVGVVNNFRDQTEYVLPVVEVVPKAEFFDYDAKYGGETDEICPGRFSEAERLALSEYARKVHNHLNLKHYSRSDFIVTDNGIYFLEVNTLPGLTENSLLPKALDAVAVTLPNFLRHVINESMHHTPDLA